MFAAFKFSSTLLITLFAILFSLSRSLKSIQDSSSRELFTCACKVHLDMAWLSCAIKTILFVKVTYMEVSRSQ